MMRLSVLLLLLHYSSALFEDQVGKFDWRHSFVGCPIQIEFDRSVSGKKDLVLLSSVENAIASLSLNTGELVWRRIHEMNDTASSFPFVSEGDVIASLASDGRSVHVWDKRKGGLKWNRWISDTPSKTMAVSILEGRVVVQSGTNVVVLNKDGESALYKEQIAANEWSSIVSSPGGLSLVYGRPGKLFVRDISGEGLSAEEAITAPWFSADKCVVSGDALFCLAGSTLHLLDPSSRSVYSIEVAGGQLASVDIKRTVAVRGTTTEFYRLDGGEIRQVLSVPVRADAVGGVSKDGVDFVLIASNSKDFALYNLNDKKLIAQQSSSTTSSAPPTRIVLAPPLPHGEYQFLSVSADCAVQFFVFNTKQSVISCEWTREESLAAISSVEMLDLPLSEGQAEIESEFEGQLSLVSSFLHRLSSQCQQLHRWLFEAADQIVRLLPLMKGGPTTLGEFLDAVRGSRSNGLRGQPLERDFFNMRRMIVVSTLTGALFGIDNADGRIVWKSYLGERFHPQENSLEEEVVPLFVQRSSALYNFQAIATVVFKDKVSQEGVLYSFNPITGRFVGRRQVERIRRVDMLPCVDKEHVHPLVVIDQQGRVTIEPELPLSLAEKCAPVYMIDVDTKTGLMTGHKLDVKSSRLQKTWTGDLHFEKTEKAVAIKGKPANQRIHSAGRVLIDRNVQYKYMNPNLVAIASLDEPSQQLSLHAVDAVSGQLIASSKLSKVSGPIHLVHCEHWLAYSYWSEKGRRTEIGIMELYEGAEQANTQVFDSLLPLRKLPEVISQSYIFAQGISAMAVSETEQGATTRSLVMALPFGGLFEVSRRIVDATRPSELTPEMREEMMIPYMPEIPIATEDMVNYNQTVHGVRGIRTFSSGLESTSLMLAYGLDVFYTRLTPSGTFDILKDDYDHSLICLVLIGLFVGSFLCKRLVRMNSLKAAWA